MKSKVKETYDAFVKSFDGFKNICGLDQLDGRWLGPLVDHMCALLVKYAEAADKEPSTSMNYLSQPENIMKPAGEQENENTKEAYNKLTALFRVLQ